MLSGHHTCNFIKKRPPNWCFRIFKNTSFKEHLQWLLLTALGFQPATLFFKRDPGKDGYPGADPEISKRDGALCRPPQLTKKLLGRRCSKKTKLMLETISFWQNISIIIFKFSPFLYTI